MRFNPKITAAVAAGAAFVSLSACSPRQSPQVLKALATYDACLTEAALDKSLQFRSESSTDNPNQPITKVFDTAAHNDTVGQIYYFSQDETVYSSILNEEAKSGGVVFSDRAERIDAAIGRAADEAISCRLQAVRPVNKPGRPQTVNL